MLKYASPTFPVRHSDSLRFTVDRLGWAEAVGRMAELSSLHLQQKRAMNTPIPSSTQRELQFENGTAIGTSQRWHRGQYCSVLTPAGIVGCGIYDLATAEEFGQAIAIAKGTPENPLVEPEDLFDAKIVGVTAQAAAMGIRIGDSGRSAVEVMLAHDPESTE